MDEELNLSKIIGAHVPANTTRNIATDTEQYKGMSQGHNATREQGTRAQPKDTGP